MFDSMVLLALYALPAALIWTFYVGARVRRSRLNEAVQREFLEAGLTEPASLHPVIDHSRCMGCGSCVAACPEHPGHKVLGLIGGKSHLIGPADCIGHGACKTACPRGAITLVFGTEKRGVDIPRLKPNFETDVPGIFIAGELGGMGLIRNAIEQGKKAVDAISKLDGIGKGEDLDVVIVGAGPAGFSATLRAMELKMKAVTVEQETLGGTVSHYPRGKVVMTSPVDLPLAGRVKFVETTKEDLLAFWEKTEKETRAEIRYRERLEGITASGRGFDVTTSKGTYRARAVLLAIGRRGTPRKLGVPGEDHEKVVYRLIDSAEYRGKHVLVVGGGDSALEAATTIAEEPGTTVCLSYRKGGFSRAKQKNRQKIDEAQEAGRLRLILNSQVTEVTPDRCRLDQEGTPVEIPNEGIIVCAGGVLPTPFLKTVGITVETKHGTA